MQIIQVLLKQIKITNGVNDSGPFAVDRTEGNSTARKNNFKKVTNK